MSRIAFVTITIISAAILFGAAGCGPQADLTLNFKPSQSDTYRSQVSVFKDYQFVQPAADKEDKKRTGSIITTTYDQMITDVDAAGNATAKITIKQLAYKVLDKQGVSFNFDSELSTSEPIASVIGKSYTISISPDGSVKLLNAGDVIASVPDAQQKRMIQSYMNPESVASRHEILALPVDKTDLTKGQTWTKTVDSPKGLLSKKNFDKQYKLTDIKKEGDSQIAMIDMQAIPGAKTGAGQMGIFSEMFDAKEDFTGRLKLDLTNAKVMEYKESLVATYVAMEESDKPELGPDTLTMGFTREVEITAMD